MDTTEQLADRWIQQDRDPTTRAEIELLIKQNDHEELERRLRQRIAFGTAGLRSAMKAGYAHMNSLTVLQASLGLGEYVKQQSSGSPPDGRLSIVVGYDARHNSEKFARLAAAAFLEKGLQVLWFGQLVHTPMVPFAVDYYKAAAGVMVTASHNPKNDNGYKVYWNNGSQIIPPHDKNIADAIDNVHEVDTWDTSLVDTHSDVRRVFAEVEKAYFASITMLVSIQPTDNDFKPFVYTPMHGVGLTYMQEVAKIIGTDAMQVVAEQAQPDPEFSTVSFPNPEEKGALNLAVRTADSGAIGLILANDPDADRFSAAERLDSGHYHQFSGNEIGILLASYVFETYTGDKSKLVMLASTVSSRMLEAMATKEGFQFRETLTGFKWLGNVAQQLQKQGLEPAFAFEEAIGYMFPTVVWDKDGIAAAAVFLMAWQRWRKQGLTPYGKLQELHERYGHFEDANTYLTSPSPAVTNEVFAHIRRLGPGGHPAKIGTRAVRRWRDLSVGYDTGTADHKPALPVDPSAQMITCTLDAVVFTARSSGTEPKIKLYIEARGTSCENASKDAKAQANEVLADLVREWFKPEYGLRLAGS